MAEGFDYEDIDSSEGGDDTRVEWEHEDDSNDAYFGLYPVEDDGEPEEPRDPPLSVFMESLLAKPPTKGRGGARVGAGKKKAPVATKRGPRSEYFTFTVQLNMDVLSSRAQIEIFDQNLLDLVNSGDAGFYSVGHEIAPQTGRHHLQGYLETSSNDVRWTFEQFKQLLTKGMEQTLDGKDRIWVKESRGSATENLNYTGKAIEEGRYYRRSEPDVAFRNYGRGNKMGAIKTLIEAGTPMLQIAKEHFDNWCKHRAAFKEFKELVSTPRMWPTQLTWIHGSTGTGKSQLVLKLHPPSTDCYWLNPPKNGNIWWDRYDGHGTVVVDEVKPNTFGLGHVGFAYILRLLDSTPLAVGVHGGMVNFAPKRIIFTANFPPSEWFKQEYCGYPWDDTNPLKRRFDQFGDVILYRSDENYWLPSKPKTVLNSTFSNETLTRTRGDASTKFLTLVQDPLLHQFRNPAPQDLPFETYNPFRDK